VHYQNEKDIDPYIEQVEAGALPLRRALRMTDEQRFIREFILQMKLGTLDLGYFKAKFDVDPAERFAPVLGAMSDQGWLTIEGDTLTLSRDSLLRVDELLPAFFLPEHRTT